MIRKFNCLILLLFLFSAVMAQKPEEILNNWSAKTPIEKIYLHLDRENYIAGETAWFKSYFYSDYLPDTISTVMYVELLDKKAAIINRKTIPVVLSNASGHLELPDSLASGYYTLRAYTPTMLNQDAAFVYNRSIYIYGNKNVSTSKPSPMLRFEFFPEGGNLVSGFTNTIAFKATNEYGLPVKVSGTVRNEKNEELSTFNSYHDGMGMLELQPVANTRYHITVNGVNGAVDYALPTPTDKGIAVTVIPHPQGHFFEVRQQKTDPAFQAAYMIGQMQHHVVFRQNFAAGKDEMQGVINTQKLHSGILQITFFNKEGMPLAERLCFVNNREYVQLAELTGDTVNFSARSKNKFSIVMKDTVKANFSISVVDPDYNTTSMREENILSTLLLTSDLKGSINNPAYYFSADNDSVKTALDLVMMTNGWRRFNWTELAKKQIPPANYKDPAYITLSGKINLRDSKRPFADKALLMMLITADSTRSIQMTKTDDKGAFRIDSMLFFGKSRLLFSDTRGKKNQYIDVVLAGDSLMKSFMLPALAVKPFLDNVTFLAATQAKMGMDYDDIQKASGITLAGITLTVKKKNPIQELDEKYAKGMFSGESSRTLDLVNTKEADSYLNILDYLQGRVPGITVATDGAEYGVYYRQTGSVSMMGLIPMTIYLNEMETDANVIASIPANQIAMVKVYSNFVGAAGNAPGGVLSIYTKKDADMADVMQSSTDMATYNGFSVTKEFYAPDYSVSKSGNGKADQRITIDWRPTIFVNNINPKIPFSFYNNDRTKNFKIVVEGMTNTGKLIFIEKTISAATLKGF